MPYQSAPRPSTVELVESLGGAIWTTCTDMANGGTGLARSQIELMDVPQMAKTLLGWRPISYPCDQALIESLIQVFDIQGKDYDYQRQEVICGNLGSCIETDAGGILHTQSEYYDVFAPVEAGQILDVGCEPCDAIAGNTRVGAEFTWTNIKVPLPVIRSVCSREVALVNAGITAGTTLQLQFAHKLIELGGAFTAADHTVEVEANVTLIVKCSALYINEVKMMFEPAGAICDLAADEGTVRGYLARRTERLRFTQEQCTVLADFDLDVAQTNAGQAVHMIRYI